MGKLLSFGLIGCGGMGGGHIGSVNALKDTKWVAVCDIIEERAIKRAGEAGEGVAYYTDLNEMLKRDDIDIVCIATPSGLHAEHGVAAAKAGKHVIVEKPIDVTLEAANKLIDTCKACGVKLMCISQHRFDEGIIQTKNAADEGKLGKLNFAASHTKWFRSQKYYDSGDWRGTWALDGGGALMNQSVHYVDMMQYIMGPVEEVTAYIATRSHNIEVEDVAAAAVKFKSGAIGLIEGNTTAYPGLYTRLDIYGDDGAVVIENDVIKEWKIRPEVEAVKAAEQAAKAALETGGYKGAQVSVTLGSEAGKAAGPKGAATAEISIGSHAMQINAFCEAVRNGTDSPVPPESSRHALAVVLAVYESAKTGKPAKVKG